jgi:peroxiredoxin
MQRRDCSILDTGDIFPKLSFNTVEGKLISLPDYFGERWNILLFYRGHW